MQIKILGTRGEIEESHKQHRKHSGVLIDGILFDLGEPEYLELKPKAIFISHLHPDHFFPARLKKDEKNPLAELDIPVFSIEKPEGVKNWKKLKKLQTVTIDGVKVTPIPTIHSRKVKSCAFLISNSKRILYTADMIWIKKQYHDLLKDLDLVITDGSFDRKGGMIRRDKETGEIYGHQGIPDLVEFFKKLGAKQIVFTHFGSWMIKDPERGKDFIRSLSDSVKVDAAYDGMVINLSQLRTTTEEIEPVIPTVIAKLQPKTALYLVPPHAEMIATGEKRLIVKSKRFEAHIGEPLYLIEDSLCYGIITLKEPYEITYEEFEKLRDLHKISDEEAFERWGWDKTKPLYAYEFEVNEIFDPPIPVKVPQGTQVFVAADKLKWISPQKSDLLSLFTLLTDNYPDEIFCEAMEELCKRGVFWKELLIKEATKTWVDDYINNLKKYTRAQIGDDFRIVLGWYSSLRRGKKLFKHTNEGDIPITEDDCRRLAVAIVKELIARGATFNRPETYKKYARELFEYVIKEIGEENIPWKDKEEKAKTIPRDPSEITVQDLENIDPPYLKTLSDEQLLRLHARLHELYRELGKVTEPLENAHIFVWEEMRERKLKHEIEDELDRKSVLEVVEYPTPETGEPQELDMLEGKISLQEALDAFPEIITVDEPIHVYLCGRIVNERAIPASHDIDILFKQSYKHNPTVHAFLTEVSKKNPEIAKRLHFVWDVFGPQIGYTVPLYRLAFVKVSPDEMRRRSPYEFLATEKPTLFKPYIGLKPKSGFSKNEFWDVKDMWEKWAKNFIDRGIMIQKKYDGMRFQVHVKGNKVQIITEDRRRDRAHVFPTCVDELLKNKKADSFIIDVEMVEYFCDKEVSDLEYCEPLEREQMIKWIVAEKKELDDRYVVFHVHDCVFFNGQPINDKGYLERWETIAKIIPKGLRHWKRVEGEIAYDMKKFFQLVKKYRSLPSSEGVVAKAIDSTYTIKYSGENRTGEWAKLKNLKEIDVMVWKVVQKKTKEGKPLDQYMYECVFQIPCADKDKYSEKDLVIIGNKCYLYIGRTYAAKEKAKPGDIITVRPIRIAEYKDEKGKLRYTWMFPLYAGKHPAKKEPDSIDVVLKLVKIGTGPLPEQLGALIFRLPKCPFWTSDEICPLKSRFRVPRENLSIEKVLVETLRFPIVCPFAHQYRCRYVKSYYYGFKEYVLATPTDEDSLEREGEEE